MASALIDNELLVPGVVSERHGAAHPFALPAGGGNLVAYPLGGELPLELGKGEKDIEGEPPHRGRGVELLGDGDEGD